MIPLLEFLNSLKADKFCKILQENFPQFVCYAETNNQNQLPQWSSDVIICGVKEWTKLTKNVEFFSFCRRYQWLPTFTGFFNKELYKNDTNVVIILEPLTTMKKKHLNYCWHFTTKENWESIKKSGLKCYGVTNMQLGRTEKFLKADKSLNNEHREGRYSKKRYRMIAPKLFVIGTNDEDKLTAIFDTIGSYSEVDNWLILKIDLRKHPNIDIYKDAANPDDSEAYYILNDIPASLIEIDKELTDALHNIQY